MDKRKILLIDDEEDLVELLNEHFSAAGYAVITAANGEDGVRLAKERRPDIILLDLMLPGLSGGEVAQMLKSDFSTRNIPIIYLTSLYTKREEADSGRAADGNTIIAKPFDSKELLAEIEKHIYKET